MVSTLKMRKIKNPVRAWHKPAFEEMRFGFEITMYILNR